MKKQGCKLGDFGDPGTRKYRARGLEPASRPRGFYEGLAGTGSLKHLLPTCCIQAYGYTYVRPEALLPHQQSKKN